MKEASSIFRDQIRALSKCNTLLNMINYSKGKNAYSEKNKRKRLGF